MMADVVEERAAAPLIGTKMVRPEDVMVEE
jgi:hypothetical protein